MTYFTGLDVSLRFVSICIVDDTGQVRYEAKVPAEVYRLVDCLRKFSDEVKKVDSKPGRLHRTSRMGCRRRASRSCA